MKNEYGLQMYSVRDITKDDLRRALVEVGKLGYKYVEFAGFFDHTAEEVVSYMKEAGVRISGTHSPVDDLVPEKLEETIAFHKAIGNKDYIIPSAHLETPERIARFAEIVNHAQPILAAEGIQLGFHNHSKEFQTMYWGSTIHTELEKRTDLHFEIDTFWAFNAGLDPIALLERLGDRVHVIHVKDGFPGGRGMALGEGMAPVSMVHDYAEKHGIRMVVESESLQPTGLEEVARCIRYLKKLDA